LRYTKVEAGLTASRYRTVRTERQLSTEAFVTEEPSPLGKAPAAGDYQAAASREPATDSLPFEKE
jgi:hypothetical protein